MAHRYRSCVRIGVLGAAEAQLDGVAVDLGTRKQRALLAGLTLHRGRPVSPDALADLIWGSTPPPSVSATLQGYVARLRRALEPDRAPRAPSTVLVTRDDAYALDLPEGALDVARFEAGVSAVHARLGAALTARPVDDALPMLTQVEESLALWRGQPFAELGDAPEATAERARLEELRAIALEDRAVLGLALGRHAVVAGELEVLTSTYPLRERLYGLHALALTRAGRQADALEVLRRVRDVLADELGLEPGQELRDLQTAVLRQDPRLGWAGTAAPSAAPSAGPSAVASHAASAHDAAWPLVGRDDQLAALVGQVELSAEHTELVVVTGEPGIGKSRLCAELAEAAGAAGARVIVGRCSQDLGAPPLFPWARLLHELGHELPSEAQEGTSDDTARFRAWEAIVRIVLDAARERHLVVVLDDLHWADTSTLRVLRLLTETATKERLLVVATWRHEPAPTGALAEVAETLARRHALRVHLTGLSAEESGEVVSIVARSGALTTLEADTVRRRTDGNPFFLVEYARLAGERGDLAALLAEEDPPAAVQDVLTRRLAALPEGTSRALRAACVLGRAFDLPTLAAVLGTTEEECLDSLDAALLSGLVREDRVDHMRFAHALVRDTAYAALPLSRRARAHARFAEVLEGQPGRESEVARHWRAAGPQHARRAWQSALAAAESARRVYAYDEAAALAQAATESLTEDPTATAEEEYRARMEHARSLQRNADWVALRSAVRTLAALAEETGDVATTLEALSLLSSHALWQAGRFGEVDEVVVALIRRVLQRLRPGDSRERCRAMLILASEIYYTSTVQEREALCDEAVAVARRLGDPALLQWALQALLLCVWRPGSADRRQEAATEAVALARELGDGVAESTALTLLATATSELGRVEEMFVQIEEARARATAERHFYALLVLDGLEIPWLAMRGDAHRVALLLTDMAVLHERISVAQSGDALMGAVLMQSLWSGDPAALAPIVDGLREVTVMPVEASVACLMCRVGRLDEARAYLTGVQIDLSPYWWFSSMVSALAAETALHLGLVELAARAYAVLLELRGSPACAGSGTILGPVDAFLAMAAHTTGERDLAARHAEDAARLCEEWEVPLAASWFARLREEHGF